MLKEIQHFIDHPDDIPDIPDASAQFLKVRLNPAYLMRTGVTDDLTKAGWSEGKIMGFLEGCASVVELIELMQEARVNPQQEDLGNVLQ
ncbi:hypothetical protein UNOSLW4_0145 [Pseudomonas phage UNO-SLW4]|uniref:Uncharacterized protein n=4 Tax=Pifdecavirus UNOSLW1 TaxID=2733661 RepID=A0A1B2AN36_9CAUD|nr:hypothetical protein HOS26_gp29 [Pseudomonas phage UNO-SLW1]ANY29044.1 hypothetical protein UNOSLW4_0145 [Pseudomonas phage UNO-SLW4]ANY29091.1 hypothetical protein UNOSLW3_0150 [Pseudomonas phage UNO-SLW3]ANY29137.1 hypothetical protein UNOSLW2_0145 [Pseudomonas phage UNO-SLW2]UZZ63891.1 hypothetical protein PSV6_31 [Pseudomonas phage PSV6]WCD55494.1 hypothetical protein AGJNDGAI_00002 [Pseudomonas phage phi C106]